MTLRIIPRAEWGAKYANGFRARPIGSLDKILHHSVTVAPDLIAPFDDDFAAVRELERIGQSRFGAGISYHIIISPVGLIFEGVGIDRTGAQMEGRNTTSMGIVFLGNYNDMLPTEAQIDATAWLLNHGVDYKWWHLNTITWGHRNLKSTACPGNKLYPLIGEINRRADLAGGAIPVNAPVSITPTPVYVKPVRQRNIAQSKATQNAVHAAPDGYWGDDTDNRVNLVRAAINGQFPQGIRVTQSIVGTKPDGAWGRNSRGSLSNTIGELQRAWGTAGDESWGPDTEKHWIAARTANYKVW